MYTEKRMQDGTWFCVDHWQLNPYFGKDEYETCEYNIVPIYDSRNYKLFATLADVRNGDGIAPIDEPRGLPDSVSKKVKEESDYWGVDGHSHSWFLASELFKYQREHSSYRVTGMISPEAAYELDEEGILPTSWCRWTNAPGWTMRSWEVPKCILDNLIEAIKRRMCEEFYIFDYGDDPLHAKRDEEINSHANDFRIVFWFDN